MNIEPVAVFHSPVQGKFGLPRQSGLAASLEGVVELLPPYNREEALRGLEGFDYVWLFWEFSLNEDDLHLTVRPPRLGGNTRVGVFASRSPFRPTRLGLSCVKIAGIDAGRGVIRVLGADLADGTPIYDIKPYVPYADSHPDARGGFTDSAAWQPLEVVFECDVPADWQAGGESGAAHPVDALREI
ncbi:MAG: tRNA (N6-threonylcarbamoyladenosine(37)-N6)-methyltransferase TrmO, partial [Desulfovibrio sp.]|nr:tRNA (N6-threonylcarbamoyladenosine(37)-N6)-methyltransferase TrmO [Desulfovibrio sp.]